MQPPRRVGRPPSPAARKCRVCYALTAAELAEVEAYRAALSPRPSLASLSRDAVLVLVRKRRR